MNENIAGLVTAYQEHIDQYTKPEYNETEVRNDFVNPFFEILGWDVLNKQNLPQYLREVKHEASVYVEENGESKKKKPDYAFNLGTEASFFLETKKPAVNIMENKDSAFQLRRYGWNGNLKASILSNFTDLLIYDCSIRPCENDDVTRALVAHYHYTEYVERYDEICRLISRTAIVSGDFDRYFSNLSSPLKKEPFNLYFLSQIKSWRYLLSVDIFSHNNHLDEEALNIFVQRILNRIIFLRICEDRNFEKYESLKNIETYFDLKSAFAVADRKYDSGLFELIDEKNLIISDDLLIDIFKDLYYPNSCYEFSVVDPYIIGQIYELFLEEKVCISADGIISVEQKPEIVDSQGVVNTPKNIADIIVQQALQPLFENAPLTDVEHYRIIDICCGSGNFLLSAFEYVINNRIEKYVSLSLAEALHEGRIYSFGDKCYSLSFTEKREILEKNIFGVDIDALAVEVTKFSLLIKLIEGCSREETDAFVIRNHTTILPNLDSNIRNGNSLVDFSYTQYDTAFYKKPHLFSTLRLFDWDIEFSGVKFNAVIGNPPYIRVQNMVHYSPEEYGYYKSNIGTYQTAKAELMDKYYLFLERALSLLSEDGMLGYIIPHKFMLIKTGRELRAFLSAKKCTRKIIHFGTNQVFTGRSTYTCLLFLTGKPQQTFEIGFVKDLNLYYGGNDLTVQQYPIEYLSSAPWSFLSEDIVEVLDKISARCQPLNYYADIFVGLQTSADNIYIIDPYKQDEVYSYFVDKDGYEQRVEKSILKPCIYDVQLEKYRQIDANKQIIFPYHKVGAKPVLYTIDEMQQSFPECLHYLICYKEGLGKRNVSKRTDDNWFQFGRSQSLRRFSDGEHLIWSVLSTTGNYVFDDTNISFTGGGNGPFYGLEMKSATKESIFYIQAIINHWLLESVVKSKASSFRGDYYSHGKQFIEQLPIYKIDFANDQEAHIHDLVVSKVKNLMVLKKRREEQNAQAQRNVIDRLIDSENASLDSLITDLYGAGKIGVGGIG